MPIIISSCACGSLTPAQALHPEVVANGDFRIEGSPIGPAVLVGNGNDEQTTWAFDFNADPRLPLFSRFRGLSSAVLTLTLRPTNTGVSTDLVAIQDLPPILTPIIQGRTVGVTATVELQLLNFPGYSESAILSVLSENDNTIPMRYGDDAVISAARLELTQEYPAFTYRVKVVCGDAPSDMLSRGTYFTTITLHNPNSVAIRLQHKFATVMPGDRGPSSSFREMLLEPDSTFEVGHRQMRALIAEEQEFLNGFVVFESDHEIEIVAVYTAGTPEVRTLHTERVPASSAQRT